jgi:benzoyl-CoA 2,3-dioxygenase component B
VERTAQVMRDHPDVDPRTLGVIDLETLQRYMNFWFAISLDLFAERSRATPPATSRPV